jgi:hypothetical protein
MKYKVTVYRRQLHSRKWSKTDSAEFPVGSFKDIGYWLDDCGYIEEDCKIDIRIG